MIAVCCAFLRDEICQDSSRKLNIVGLKHLIHILQFFSFNLKHNICYLYPHNILRERLILVVSATNPY